MSKKNFVNAFMDECDSLPQKNYYTLYETGVGDAKEEEQDPNV